MIKIGILTYHSVCNFGANLQALSTVGYFRKHGFEPIIINWVPHEIENQYRKSIPSNQYAEHENFVSKHLPITDLCRTDDEILRQIEVQGIHAIVIGSDAVVQHKSLYSRVHFPTRSIVTVAPPPPPHLVYPNPFWGSLVHMLPGNIPILMMSVSSQNERFIGIQGRSRNQMWGTLKLLPYISVRDRWTQKMFQHISRGALHPKITPDPVFAFNQNAGELIQPKDELVKRFGLAEKYILFSFVEKMIVDEGWVSRFADIALLNGYQCLMLPMPNGHCLGPIPLVPQLPNPLSPLDWYGLIKYSSAYIGHNMHPMVVAMHNNVPFYTFDYYGILYLRMFLNSKSSKIYDILERAGLLSQRSADIGPFASPPDPNLVFESVMHLKGHSSIQTEFSNLILEEYNQMMSELSDTIRLRVCG